MASTEKDLSHVKRLLATKYLSNNKEITDHILRAATAGGKKELEHSSRTLGQMLASPKLFEMLEKAGFGEELKNIDKRIENLISKQLEFSENADWSVEQKTVAAWKVMDNLNDNFINVANKNKDKVDPIALRVIGSSMKVNDPQRGDVPEENRNSFKYHELNTAKMFSSKLVSYQKENKPSLAKRVAQFFSKTPKMETPKVQAPKVETPKAEAPKSEAPKAEAPKVESSNTSKEPDIAYAKRLLATRYLANYKNITDHIFNSASFGGKSGMEQTSKELGQMLASPKLFNMLKNAGFGDELKEIDKKVENQIEKQLNAIGKGGMDESIPSQMAEKEQAAWRAIKALNINHSKYIKTINDNNNPVVQELAKSVSASMRAGDNLRDGVSQENANNLKFHEIFAATAFASKLVKHHQENNPSLAKRVAQFFSKTPKVETPKVETPKVETPKAEAPKVETPKAEAPKVETPKVEEPKVIVGNFNRQEVEAPEVTLDDNKVEFGLNSLGGFNFEEVAANDNQEEPTVSKLEGFNFDKIDAANESLSENAKVEVEPTPKNSNVVKFKPK